MTVFMLGSGVFWTVAYLLIIWRSWRDRTYGMPLVALCANISWEFIFSFVYPSHDLQLVVNIIWFVLDVIILILTLCYAPNDFDFPQWLFYVFFALMLGVSFVAVLLVTVEFRSSAYAAFGQNLMMSVLFCSLWYRRRPSLRGQSLSIAVCKLLGTACASWAFYAFTTLPHMVLPFLYVATFVYDAIYVGLVLWQMRAKSSLRMVVGEAQAASLSSKESSA
ncbi:MAG: hypothetical protein J2P36_39675 [Ktedonobacteraceae bacterium]|nr:hypothetical protein [Ktedonobacteraceae bacterium]